MAAKTPHLADVLLPAHRVDDTSGAQEEEGLEKGVRHEVEDSRREGAHPARQEHVAKLADGGVSEDPFDVVLHQGDGGGQQGGRRPDDGDRHQSGRGQEEEDVGAGDHVDAGRHHGGGVNEGADGGGSFHGVGEPGVERDLGRLAGGPQEEEERDGRRRRPAGREFFRRGREDVSVVQRSERREDQKEAHRKAEVAHAVDDKRLLPGVGRGLPLVPKTDEQVRAEPNALPADEEEHEVVGQDQERHRKEEQVEVGEIPGLAGIVVHVADGIDVNDEAHARHHEDHHRREGVEEEGRPHDEIPRGDPGIEGLDGAARPLQTEQGEEGPDGRREAQAGRNAGDGAGRAPARTSRKPAEHAVDDCPQGGENRNQPEEIEHSFTA